MNHDPVDTMKYDFQISVATRFLEQREHKGRAQWVFAYTITITNIGTVGAKLLNRHWIIKDSESEPIHVHGEGVVGEQPHLMPGERFEYTSGTALESPVGTMEGAYEMVADDGQVFEVDIPQFVLSAPRTLH